MSDETEGEPQEPETPGVEAAPDGAEDSAADADAPDAGGAGTAVAVASAPVALEAGPPPVDPVADRLLLPLLLPILSMLAIAVLVLNISRVLLASGSSGSVVVGTLITVVILGGAAWISSSPKLRTSTLSMLTASFVVIVVGAGLITLGPSEGESSEAAGFEPPKGPAVATLEVDALPTLKFQSDQFTVTPAGITDVVYNDLGGSHTLLFTDPKLSGFELKVPSGPTKEKVELEPGEYTIYCSIPGHRAAGMEATVTVTGDAAAADATTTTAGS